MTDELCTLVKDRFEKFSGEFGLAGFIGVRRVPCPHVGDEDNVFQRLVTAKFTEHLEVPSGDSGKPNVGDTMDVDDSGKLGSFLVPVRRFGSEDRETTNADVHLRSGQESGNHFQNVRIALRGVVETRGIDESYTPSVESELVCELDLGSTRL